MIRVGITGGMASGKSTVCRTWSGMGAFVLDADQLAKDLMRDDPELRREIVSVFGPRSYHEDGTLDRVWIADQAFNHGGLERLNSIVHPVVRRKSKELMDKAERMGFSVGVREAALLLTDGRPQDLDVVVLVRAMPPSRIERASLRDRHLNEDQIRARMKAQPRDEEMARHADFIIDNEGSLAELEENARACYRAML